MAKREREMDNKLLAIKMNCVLYQNLTKLGNKYIFTNRDHL
jgi:hypothetical protein